MKRTLTFLALLVVAASLFATGQGEATGEETIELKWQVWITPNLTRDFYEDVANAFMEENPSVEIEIIEVSATGASGAADFLRNRIAAGDIPDVMNNVGEVPTFADAGVYWPMPVDDPDLERVNNLMSAAYEGNVYMLPITVQPQNLMFYNKSLWAEAGLTEADIPTTMEELGEVATQIKGAGYTPILTGGEWVPQVFFEYFVGPTVATNYPELWTKVYAGELSWTDPTIMEAVEWLDTFVKEGYFNEGALSIGYASLEQEFLKGNGAMYPMGTWFTAAAANADIDFDIGVFPTPTVDGENTVLRSAGYGSSPAVAAASEHPEMAFELVKFFSMDETFGSKFIEVDGLYSNLDPPLTYDMTELQMAVGDLVANADYVRSITSHVLGEAAPPGVPSVYITVGEAILTQSYDSLEGLMERIDEFAAESR